NLQFEENLDSIAWEMLGLGAGSMAEHFALGRQLVSGTDPAPAPRTGLAEELAVVVVHGDLATGCLPQQRRVALDALAQEQAGDAVSTAHVLVLDGVGLADLFEREDLPRRECLLVAPGPQPTRQLAAALDRGSAALLLGPQCDLGESLEGLLLQLGTGAS